jgi:hypothetical protein
MLNVTTSPTHKLITTSPTTTTTDRHERSATRRRFQPTAGAAGLGVLTVLSLLLALFFILAPYNRGIIGEREGSRVTVETACAAPIVAVSADGSRAVNAQGTWVSSEAPCQRSAAFRLGLGAVILVGAAGLGVGAWRKSYEDA